MNSVRIPLLGAALIGWVLVLAGVSRAADPPPTGPETEKRFPPLRLPAGFSATLFACDPLVAYPSAIALGPDTGTLFVAIDYMTGLGTEIIQRDEVRLVQDTDGDGYADRAPLWAGEFNSIQGMTYHDGTLYVMHSPLLTALRDVDGDGRADERRDLIVGLGLAPEKDPVRLHNANGLAAGHDGWLYLALGDHGCDVARPEGDRLVLEGGGILRCRGDGRDLHVFATGLRNIYDVALDDGLNVFVRDNENDGGDYKIRVCHSFFGADHGYPYLYYERPAEALPPLADLGLGSSAGGVCYLERQFPAEFRGQLFFCEWGKAVVRYAPRRAGARFEPVSELPFAAGADNDPYGFKPTDLVVDRDGSLIVADWADGQRPKRGRARIYRVRFGGDSNRAPDPGPGIARLDSDSYYVRLDAQLALERQGPPAAAAVREAIGGAKLGVRGRMHAVWILARTLRHDGIDDLFKIAETDPEPRVQAQAVRALADLTDPMLLHGRIDAGPGDRAAAERLATLGERADPELLLDVINALARLRWTELPGWLQRNRMRLCGADATRLKDVARDKLTPGSPLEPGHGSAGTRVELDPALAHAAMQALRRSNNWRDVLKLLDEPAGSAATKSGSPSELRGIALRSFAGRYEPQIVDGLVDRLASETDPRRRRELAELLCRMHRKPPAWVYWGFRPAPRPANSVQWERTAPIEQSLDRVLADPDVAVRMHVLKQMQREKVPTRLESLAPWMHTEDDAERLAAIVDSIREHPRDARRELVEPAVRDARKPAAIRQAALALWAEGIEDLPVHRLLALAVALEDGPVLVRAIGLIGVRNQAGLDAADARAIASFLLGKSQSADAAVRAASVEALSLWRVERATHRVAVLLTDEDSGVRRAAATAAARLGVRDSIPTLLGMARDADGAIRQASLDALRQLGEPAVLPLAITALEDAATQRIALECLAALGGPEHARPVVAAAMGTRSADILERTIQMLAGWSADKDIEAADRQELELAVDAIHGAAGVLLRWRVAGPMPAGAAAQGVERFANERPAHERVGNVAWQAVLATGPESRVRAAGAAGTKPSDEGVWLAYADIAVPEPVAVQFFASSDRPLRAWVNGQEVYKRGEPRRFQPDSDRFEAALKRGSNRLMLQLSPERAAGSAPSDAVEFHARFRKKSSRAEHERLTEAALARSGNVDRGRKLLLDVEKSQCLNCHRLRERGEPIGPDLTGLGSRFSRIHIVESVLEPSRTIAAGYQTVAVSLRDGRVFTGMKISESADAYVFADQQGKTQSVPRGAIDELRPSATSIMPEGLERSLTADEFVDLISYLSNEKSP